MTEMLGHNSGTPAEIVRDQLGAIFTAKGATAAGQSLEERKVELIAAAGRVKVTDNDAVGRAGDLQAMIARLIERVEVRATETVEPYALAIGAMRSVRDKFTADLQIASDSVRAAVTQFRSDQRDKALKAAEEQRVEEAKRRAALNVEPVAPVPAPVVSLPAVVGDYGSRTSDRKLKVYTWKDPRKVDRKVLDHPAVAKAMQQACRDLNRVQAKITGVVISDDVGLTVRK